MRKGKNHFHFPNLFSEIRTEEFLLEIEPGMYFR